MPYFEEEATKHVDRIFERADAFLFGRKTYEIFASYWPAIGDDNAIAAALNSRPKHVVSSTLGELSGTVPRGWTATWSRPSRH
jgi:dihydrofolate reductase